MSTDGVAAAPAASERGRLEAECERLARYLIGRSAPARVRDRYARGHEAAPGRFAPRPGVDATILALATSGRVPLRALDVTARFLAPGGALRRKLVLLAGLLECVPETAAAFEVPDHPSPTRFLAGLAGRGAVTAAALALGVVATAIARLAGVGAPSRRVSGGER